MDAKRTVGEWKTIVWRWLAAGAGAGLYTARIVAEFGPFVAPGWGVTLLAVACAVLGAAAAQRLARRADLRPLLIAWLYVLYPALDAGVAAAVGWLALCGAFITNSGRRSSEAEKRSAPSLALPALVFLLALALYTLTLAPDVLTADNAEYQLVAARLGVAHPPGYALYTLLGRLFTLLPLATPAWRVSLFAAVTGALALALVARATQRLGGSAWAGAAAALALGVAPTFWAQSTTANIRGLTALFTAWCFDALLAFDQARRRGESGRRALDWFALGLGLGFFHHFSLGFMLPAFGLYLLLVDPALIRQPRRWIRPVLIFLATSLVLIYFPIRGASGAVLAPDHLTTWSGFLEHVTGQGFGGDMFAFLRGGVLPHRFTILVDILVFQFGWPLLVVAGLGALALLRRDGQRLLLFGPSFALFGFLVATYRAPQTVEYLMPAYVPLAVMIGHAAAAVLQARRWPPLGAWLAALILLPGMFRAFDHYPSFALLHRDRTGRDYAAPILRAAPPDAVVLSNWHWATTFWYLQEIEGMRPDVAVIYIYPQGESYAANWAACIQGAADAQPECLAAAVTAHPLIVTDWYREYESLPLRFVPFEQAFLIARQPLSALPAGLLPLDVSLQGLIRLAGYRLESHTTIPGHSLAVDIAWQPQADWAHDYSFFVQLLGPTGLVGQGRDIIQPAGHYRLGEVVIDRHEVAVWPTAPPGEYTLIAGVYFTPQEGGWQRLIAPDGRDYISLGTVRVEAATSPPVTLHPLRYRFEGGPSLIGVDFDHSPGLPRRVYLHWALPSRQGDGDAIQLTIDGQPAAQGQLSTLPHGGYLTTAHDVPAGSLAVTVENASHVGPWGLLVRRPARLPQPATDARYVPLGGEMALAGVEVRRGVTLAAAEGELFKTAEGSGEVLQVDLCWLSLGPLTRDRVVSVQALAWGQNHDSVPALGAIPTLKWVRGVTLRDRHFIRLPGDAGAQAELTLVVYDHFVQRQSLLLLDERLAKMGDRVPLGVASPGD
ncbi:MAG: protein O-mannosyl-transferase family [Chloroflexota bacterium]